MTYRRIIESKVLRVRHRAEFYIGSRARDVVKYFESIPPDAKVTDVGEGEPGEECYIEFLEEKETT